MLVSYLASRKLQESIFAKTGTMPKAIMETKVDLTTLTDTERAQIAPHVGTDNTITLNSFVSKNWGDHFSKRVKELDAPPSAMDILLYVQTLETEKASAIALGKQCELDTIIKTSNKYRVDFESAITKREILRFVNDVSDDERQVAFASGIEALSHDAAMKEYKTLRESLIAEKETREKANKEAEEKLAAGRNAEKHSWSEKFGSDQLKRGLKAGHSCTRLYAIERAAKEYPGFDLDFNDQAAWSSRSCPSVEALDALDDARKLNPAARIVWLTKPASNVISDDDEYGEEEFSPCEAIVIEDFMERYDLVKTI